MTRQAGLMRVSVGGGGLHRLADTPKEMSVPLRALATLFVIAPSPFRDDAPTTIRIALAVALISAATILVVLRVRRSA